MKPVFTNKEFKTTVNINSKGFRNHDHPYENNEKLRMVLFGDSFSFGWGVDVEDSVATLLERRYPTGAEVINLSVSGYNTIQEWEKSLVN